MFTPRCTIRRAIVDTFHSEPQMTECWCSYNTGEDLGHEWRIPGCSHVTGVQTCALPICAPNFMQIPIRLVQLCKIPEQVCAQQSVCVCVCVCVLVCTSVWLKEKERGGLGRPAARRCGAAAAPIREEGTVHRSLTTRDYGNTPGSSVLYVTKRVCSPERAIFHGLLAA